MIFLLKKKKGDNKTICYIIISDAHHSLSNNFSINFTLSSFAQMIYSGKHITVTIHTMLQGIQKNKN